MLTPGTVAADLEFRTDGASDAEPPTTPAADVAYAT